MNDTKKAVSDYLFSTSNMLSGIASIINIPGNFYEFNLSKNPDQEALKNDLAVIGEDMNNILEFQCKKNQLEFK